MELQTKEGMVLITKEELNKINELKLLSQSVLLSLSITWRKVEKLEKLLKEL